MKSPGSVSSVPLFAVFIGFLTIQADALCNLTFDDVIRECLTLTSVPGARLPEYNLQLHPASKDTMCTIRCVGLVLRFWNDSTGIHPAAIQQYYRPATDDHCYLNRTQSCLNSLYADPSYRHGDVCERAHRSFLCFHQQYGYLDIHTPQYVRKTEHEMLQAQVDCLNILGMSMNWLRMYNVGRYPNEPKTHCFVRCVGLHLGLYSDHRGPDIDRLYIQLDVSSSRTTFRTQAEACIEYKRQQQLDKCATAYGTLYECFRDDHGRLPFAVGHNVKPPATCNIIYERFPVHCRGTHLTYHQ